MVNTPLLVMGFSRFFPKQTLSSEMVSGNSVILGVPYIRNSKTPIDSHSRSHINFSLIMDGMI